MRLAGQAKAGYYPTPPAAVERIKAFLAFPEEEFALDGPGVVRTAVSPDCWAVPKGRP